MKPTIKLTPTYFATGGVYYTQTTTLTQQQLQLLIQQLNEQLGETQHQSDIIQLLNFIETLYNPLFDTEARWDCSCDYLGAPLTNSGGLWQRLKQCWRVLTGKPLHLIAQHNLTNDDWGTYKSAIRVIAPVRHIRNMCPTYFNCNLRGDGAYTLPVIKCLTGTPIEELNMFYVKV